MTAHAEPTHSAKGTSDPAPKRAKSDHPRPGKHPNGGAAATHAHDRYANQEVNYLLQRIESFTGIAMLTTNHESAVDEAFRRRLSMHIRFPMPERDERSRLWQAMIPAKAAIAADVDFERLAEEFTMSGGYIRNAVLRAAFLAADAGEGISMRTLWHAARGEYEAMGKIATMAAAA
jgi:AAA+ superfamily predicted ATPase